MRDVDLDAVRERDRNYVEFLGISGEQGPDDAEQDRHDLLTLLAEKEVRIAELEGLLRVRGDDVAHVLGERDRLRAAAQAVVNQARVGRRRIIWIAPEPFHDLAAALEGRDE